MKKITNTQYLKKGIPTNVGIVLSIQDNAWFTTIDGFSHNVSDEDIKLITKAVICRYCETDIPDGYVSNNSYEICPKCDLAYDNKTGHCSLSCCITGECDESC